jgi:hypothetical protein
VHAYRNPRRSRSNLNGEGLLLCGQISQSLCERVNRHRNNPQAANEAVKQFLYDWSNPGTSIDCIGATEAARLHGITEAMLLKQKAMPVAGEEFGGAIFAIAERMHPRSAFAYPLATLNCNGASLGHAMSLILIRQDQEVKISLYDPNFSGNDMHIKIRLDDRHDLSLLSKLTLEDFMPDDRAVQVNCKKDRTALLALYCGNGYGVNIYRLDEDFMIEHACCFAGLRLGSQIAQAGLALASGNAFHLEMMLTHLRRQPAGSDFIKKDFPEAVRANAKRLQDALLAAARYHKVLGLGAYADLLVLADIRDQELLHALIPASLRGGLADAVRDYGSIALTGWEDFLRSVPHLAPDYVARLLPRLSRKD